MSLSGVLHWLLSQSIFLVALEPKTQDLSNSNYESYSVSDDEYQAGVTDYSCGWSPLVAVLTLVGGFILLFAAIGTGFKRYSTSMSLGATNSAVIAAGCDVDFETEEEAVELRKLKWGVVSLFDRDEKVMHCAMSSKDPSYPEHGTLYA